MKKTYISDTGEKIKVYRCDPEKHKGCKKRGCFLNGGECKLTLKKEYSAGFLGIIKQYIQKHRRMKNEKQGSN